MSACKILPVETAQTHTRGHDTHIIDSTHTYPVLQTHISHDMTAYTHRHLRKFQRETLAKLQSPAQTTQRRGAFSSCWRLACCSFLGATSLIAPHSVYNQHAIPESVVLRNKRRQGVMVVVVVVVVAGAGVVGRGGERRCYRCSAAHQ